MVTIITGAIIGMTAGLIAGEGMEVERNEKGRKIIKRIDWRKGVDEVGEDAIIGGLTLAAIFGTVALMQAGVEAQQEQWKEKEEFYENKRGELLERVDIVVDEAANYKYEKAKDEYLAVAEIARNYEGDLSGVTIASESGFTVNKFEAYGLASISDQEIKNILLNDTEKEKEYVKEETIDRIENGYWWELDQIEYEIGLLEKELF